MAFRARLLLGHKAKCDGGARGMMQWWIGVKSSNSTRLVGVGKAVHVLQVPCNTCLKLLGSQVVKASQATLKNWRSQSIGKASPS
eukprot:1158991-Pelagomonas_calceolata.AAC.4